MNQRSLAVIPVLALTIAGLAACSGVAGAEPQCAPAGKQSKAVEVAGTFGSLDLDLTSDAPERVKSMQRSVLVEGGGEQLKAGDSVQSVVSVFNGEDGERISAESARLSHSDTSSEWIMRAISCATVGDRIAAVLPAGDVYGEGRVLAAGVPGLAEESSLLVVIDLQQAVPGIPGTITKEDLLERAEGERAEPPASFPAVDISESGKPTVTIPEGAPAPDSVQTATLVAGEGEEVRTGDRVYLRSTGTIWRTGEEFESTWAGEPMDYITTGMIPGLSKGLEGQRVGSQVMILVPAADGYGETALAQMGHAGDDVMVFVIDILGAAHPAE